eukprot:498819-Hanusia_phi.AAC.1
MTGCTQSPPSGTHTLTHSAVGKLMMPSPRGRSRRAGPVSLRIMRQTHHLRPGHAGPLRPAELPY